MEINNPTLMLFLIFADRLAFSLGEGTGLQQSIPQPTQSLGKSCYLKSQCNRSFPQIHTPPLPLPFSAGRSKRCLQAWRRKHLGTSFESLPIPHWVKGELINARHAQRVGEGASAWVGGPGRLRRCTQCGRRGIWRPELAGLCWQEVIGRWLGQGAQRCPQGVPRLILGNSDLPPTGPSHPTHRVLQNSHSFRPELISSLPAA